MISPLFRPHSSSVTASRRRQLIDYGMIATGDHEHQRFAARSTTPGGSCASQATGGSPHHLSALVRDDLFSIVLPVIARLRSSRGNLPVRSTRFVHAVGAVLCAARFFCVLLPLRYAPHPSAHPGCHLPPRGKVLARQSFFRSSRPRFFRSLRASTFRSLRGCGAAVAISRKTEHFPGRKPGFPSQPGDRHTSVRTGSR